MQQISIKDYEPDIKTHWDRIFIGPFGEILRLLSEFNERYGTSIGVTNKLAWKRGSYDQVKEAMSVVADAVKKRPKSMYSIFDNRRKFNWRGRTLESSITAIQKQMMDLKWQGAKVDYKTAVDTFEKAKETMIIDTSDIKKIDKDISVNMYVESHDDIIEDNLCIEYVISNIVLKVKGFEDEVTLVTHQEFECGDVHIKATRNVFHYINGSRDWVFNCIYHPNDEILVHPYVSKTSGAYFGNYRHHCFGDFDSNFRVSLNEMDIFGFAVFARRWLSEFVTNKTVPLNGPSKLYIGNPEHLNREYVIRHAKSAGDCDPIISRSMLFHTQPEDFEYNPQDTEGFYRGSDSKWHQIANRIKDYIAHSYYLETVKEAIERRRSVMSDRIDTPENFLIYRGEGAYKSEEEVTDLITNAAKWGANKCQEIKCTLRDSCRFGYQLKVVADTLVEGEADVEKECKQNSALAYIRLKTVQDWCRDRLYLMQDDDPDAYEDIPEELRREFHHLYNDLCDHLRGQTDQKDQIHNMFRMYLINQLKPRSQHYTIERFLVVLERVEHSMNKITEFLNDPDEHVALDEEANDKLARVKKHVPGWDDLSSEEKSKAIATLVNAKII